MGLRTPTAITLVRIAARRFDDDNLQAAFKSARDGVADAFNLRDDAKHLSWRYAQEKPMPGLRWDVGVRVEIAVQQTGTEPKGGTGT